MSAVRASFEMLFFLSLLYIYQQYDGQKNEDYKEFHMVQKLCDLDNTDKISPIPLFATIKKRGLKLRLRF